ncbi:hypothetical protein D3C81_815250 [compost metagenome]
MEAAAGCVYLSQAQALKPLLFHPRSRVLLLDLDCCLLFSNIRQVLGQASRSRGLNRDTHRLGADSIKGMLTCPYTGLLGERPQHQPLIAVRCALSVIGLDCT